MVEVTTYYSFSHDGRKLLYASDSSAPPGLWITDLDRGTLLGKLMRVNEDGSERHEISPDPILYLHDVSPDGQWAVVNAPGAGAVGAVSNVRAYSLRDGKPSTICDVCGGGFGPRQVGKPFITWAPDGRFLYLSLHWVSLGGADKTAVIPLRGAPFNLTPHGSISEADLRKTFGARIVNERDVYPGPDPDTYVFTRYTTLTNIYRIIVP